MHWKWERCDWRIGVMGHGEAQAGFQKCCMVGGVDGGGEQGGALNISATPAHSSHDPHPLCAPHGFATIDSGGNMLGT